MNFLLKKERVLSFGVLPSKYSGRWRGFNMDEAKQNYFCGRKRICFASTLFCKDFVSPAQEGAGGMRGGFFVERKRALWSVSAEPVGFVASRN